MRGRFSILVLIFFVFANVKIYCIESQAATENGTYNFKVVISCQSYLQAYKDEDLERAKIINPDSEIFYNKVFHSYAYFILGFVSGSNLFAPGVREVLPFDHLTILDLVKRRCEVEPLNHVAGVTNQVIWNNFIRWKTD